MRKHRLHLLHEQTVARLSRRHPSGAGSLRVAARVRGEFPDVKLIAIDQLPIHEDVVEFVNAGVSGFLMKDDPVDHLANTIRLVECGAKVLLSAMVNTLFSQIARKPMVRSPATSPAWGQMTAREREVIKLIAEGLSNNEISARLNIAIHTVKSHVHLRRCGQRRLSNAAHCALRSLAAICRGPLQRSASVMLKRRFTFRAPGGTDWNTSLLPTSQA